MNLNLKAALLAAAVALAAVVPSRAQVQAPNVSIAWLPLGKISAGMNVTTSAGAATALPSGGDTVYVFNTGANDAFVAVGASSVVASATGNGSTLVKAGTCANINRRNANNAIQNFISAVTGSSTTTLAVETGIGSAGCSGGAGGGGGGGGAVTMASGAVAAGAYSAGSLAAGAGVDGWDVTQGTKTEAACAGDATSGCSVEQRLQRIAQNLTTINTSINSPLPNGTNLIGDVNLRQAGSPLSTTNGAFFNQLQGNAVLSLTNPTFTRLTDGTTGTTVKAASTPPATTDTALVTAERPATPITPIAAQANDNHANLKNGAGVAMSVHTSNNSATKNYLRLYDAGTGFNGCNSATGVIFAMEIPPSDGGFSVSLGGGSGIAFTNGLSWCITSGFGLTDTTAATPSAIYANASVKP